MYFFSKLNNEYRFNKSSKFKVQKISLAGKMCSGSVTIIQDKIVFL